MDFERVRQIGHELPGVEDGTSYGTPGLKVRGKFLTRLREEDDSIVIKVGTIVERDYLLKADPNVFFIAEHYREYPAVLVRLSTVTEPVLREMMTNAWRRVAPKKLLALLERPDD